MADLARALSTPVPSTTQEPAKPPAPAAPPASRTPAGPDPRSETEADTAMREGRRDAKNKRDQQRRKEKRAADAKAAKLAAAKPKKKKAKKKTGSATDRALRKAEKQIEALPVRAPKKRKRGRPPGAKNKPKPWPTGTGMVSAVVPARTVPRGRPTLPAQFGTLVDPFSVFLALRDVLGKLSPAQRVQVLAALVNEK